MVPTNNPSRDEPGQRDLSLRGRSMDALRVGGVVGCCVLIFVGEFIVVVPVVAIYHAVVALFFTIILAPFNYPLWLAVGSIWGLLHGVTAGIQYGVQDIQNYLQGGWQHTNAWQFISNL